MNQIIIALAFSFLAGFARAQSPNASDRMIPPEDVYRICMEYPAQLFPMGDRRQRLICESMTKQHVAISFNFLDYCLVDPGNRVDSAYCADDYAGLGKLDRATSELCQKEWTRNRSLRCLQQFIQTETASK